MHSHLPTSRRGLRIAATFAGLLIPFAAGRVLAQEPAEGDNDRAIFNAEICKVDGLKAAQCDCVWNFIKGKLSSQDLRLAILLTASGSEDSATAKKADEQLDKSNASDKRRDALSSEISALIIEGEDACP